ncbi:cytochrome P450 [Penicillium malachiteum]|uniref:Cytochrome P450 n=1 Tax=Penicillium malachiteum TaxID=1324776 RepID=A0AAD6HUX3_9EURO|nr:cytochrome P450 [Penicillium malachiteum]
MLLQLMGLSVLGYLAWSLVVMESNYRRASSMGIPLVRLPVDPQNVLWMIIEPHVWPLLDRLPIDWGTFRFSRRGWYFGDKGKAHQVYGPIFAVVTPLGIFIHIADSEAINDMFQRRADFIRPVENYKVLEVYGPCISTANWANWPRHRKVLASPFNESVMSFVWDQSTEQTRQMLDSWATEYRDQIPSVAKDTRTLSLNVLAATGFRKSYPFNSAAAVKNEGDAGSYRDALQTVLDNCILLMIAPRKMLTLPFAPKSWHELAEAANNFKQHMVQMLDEEMQALNSGSAGSGSLMTSFVRAMDLREKASTLSSEDSSNASSKGLSVDEIFGNIFVINFAGHDTTANTLSFAMLLLAANPDVQDWVAEELQQIDSLEGNYAECFPKFNRCKAVMFETLRHFPPIPSLPKSTSDQPQILKVGEKDLIIPANVAIAANMIAVHIDSRHWEDPLAWKPSRWIASLQSSSEGHKIDQEEIKVPQKCTYFPWSEGPQNCPGNKFSQVEFVAVLAKLLRENRVYPIRNSGETPEQTRARVLETTRDVDLQLLLRMRDADQVRLGCKRYRAD